MRPLVTIGISTYNRADGYLRQALRSALAQGYPRLEIVVSDNGSTDGTEAFIKGFNDPRIRYFKQAENIGANPNFNFCLEQARGDYFLLLHDDDILDADFVETCMQAVDYRTDLGVIRTGTRVINAEGEVIAHNPNRMQGLSTSSLFINWFSQQTAFYFCSTLFHTAHLKALGGLRTKTNVFEDVVAIARLSARYGRADIYENKASFRLHGNNKGSSQNTVNDWAEDSLYLLEVLAEEMPGDTERLKDYGQPYLCRRLYRYASKLPTLAERVRSYAWIYKTFGYSYSPLRYLYERSLRRTKDALRPIVKGQRSPT